VDYEDALDMYADDFDEKEKARMEQQAEKKNKGEESVGVNCMESGKPEVGSATGNGIAKIPTSSSQDENQGNVFFFCIACYIMFELIKNALSSDLMALILYHIKLWKEHNLFYFNIRA
jgi:hypothetical protein